jgi:hypothetical protein
MTTDSNQEHGSSLKGWLILFLLVLFILFKGGLAYTLIGDPGQPDWDYRPVKDIPAESPYAVYEVLPNPQHVRGEKGE